MLLLGGWILLLLPEPGTPSAPTASWKKVREYDTAWRCEEGRREKAAELTKDTAEEQRASGSGTLDAMLRYRCERTERLDERQR